MKNMRSVRWKFHQGSQTSQDPKPQGSQQSSPRAPTYNEIQYQIFKALHKGQDPRLP